MCSLLEIRATRGVISVVLRDVRSMLMSESQMCTVFLLRRYLDASRDASQSTLNLTLIVAPAGSPEVLDSNALCVAAPPRPGGAERPLDVQFVPTPLPSPSPQRARHSHATAHLLFKHSRVLACSCSKRPSRVVAAGHVHVCVMDDNRPTPLRSRARTGRKGIWKTQRSRSSFYVCRVEELILRSTVFYNVVPLVTDLSGSLGPVHCTA